MIVSPSLIIPCPTAEIDTPQVHCSENFHLMSDSVTHMVRGTWLSKDHEIFHYGLPTPLMDFLRSAWSPMPLAKIPVILPSITLTLFEIRKILGKEKKKLRFCLEPGKYWGKENYTKENEFLMFGFSVEGVKEN